MSDIGAVPVRSNEHERALQLYREGKYEESARLLSDLLKTRENSELWNDWATAQLMLGKRAESEEGYRRALELDPRSCQAAGNLGVLLATSGRIPEAIPLFERAANGSVGPEREQLLGLIQRHRAQVPADPQTSFDKALLLQMATVIHQQSQAIAGLMERVAVIESRINQPPFPPPQSASGGRQVVAGTSPRLSVATFRAPSEGGGVSTEGGPATTGNEAVCPSAAELHQPGVYFSGIVYGGSGYAEEGWPVALGLAQHKMPVQLVPFGPQSDHKNLIPEASRKTLESLERQLVDIPKSVLFRSGPAPGWNSELAGRVRVGRTMFETNGLTVDYRDRCNGMDEVWVPSHFNLETFTKGGVDKHKLRLVPGGVDAHIFHPDGPPLELKPKRTFNFLSVFDWHLRKGYDVLLRAYLHEFSPDDDVALILKVYQITESSYLEAQIGHFIERTAGLPMEKAPVIVLLNGFVHQSQMAQLYATADAFVLPSRGEAYGRPYLEAMACRLPVIATNWSGQLDFLNHQNSYLIDSRLAPVPSEVEIEYYRGQCWAEPSVDHLRQIMREVYSHPDEARKRAERGREDVLHNYDWSVVMPRWIGEFQRLLN
jgi:glycosyltransferase involved in cell wall biosynthesis